MDRSTEIFIREFFLQTKDLSDKELSDYLNSEKYRNINYFDESKGHLDVVFEIIANERKVDLGGLTENFDYEEPVDRNELEHRIVLVFSNTTFTSVERKIVRIRFKHGYKAEQIVQSYLKNKGIDYTYQKHETVEYISNDIHNVNHVFYVFNDDCSTDIFELTPRNKEDAVLWLEHLNKLFILSMSKDFSNKIENKKTYLKNIINR